MGNERVSQLSGLLKTEVTLRILPFWMNRMKDPVNGGFYGRMDGNNNLVSDAPKGGILNARILWTFSSAFRIFGMHEYLDTATYAFNYCMDHFIDREFGGTYWSLGFSGKPLDMRKQVYSQAFFIYAFSEYFRATGEKKALEEAIRLFELIEQHSFDHGNPGYFEALDRQWQPMADVRLSEKDANEKKTMNTHLHILEAYTNLYRCWQDPRLGDRIRILIRIFSEHIVNSGTCHLDLFFDENWQRKSSVISYGHDIESSWLLYEAAEVLNDSVLQEETAGLCRKIVTAAMEGLTDNGSLIYERHPMEGLTDDDRHWWPQAEAVVGFVNAWELTGDESYLRKADDCFRFIRSNLIDPENGEWFWSIRADGTVNRDDDKAGFWKCPYHNARMCFEIIRRAEPSHNRQRTAE